MNIDKIIREEIQKLNETAGKNVSDKFFEKILQKLGTNSTPEKLRFFRAWQGIEDTDATNNPLATTWDTQVAGQTAYNYDKKTGKELVKNYPSDDVGIRATVNTLTKSGYPGLLNKLKQDDITAEELAAETAELDKWGTGGAKVANNLGTATQTNSEEEVTAPADDEELIDKIQFYLDFAGFVPFIGDAIDIANGLIYLIRAQKRPAFYVDALLSLLALAPVIGSIIAVPMRIAFKSAKKFLKPNVLKQVFKGQKSWDEILDVLSNKQLLGDAALDANSLETLAQYGDDIAKTLNDGTQALLSRFPDTGTIRDLAKQSEDMQKIIVRLGDDAAAAAQRLKTGGQFATLKSANNVLDPSVISNLGTKLVGGFIKDTTKITLRGIGKFMFSSKLWNAVAAGDDVILKPLIKQSSKQFTELMTKSGAYPALFRKAMRSVDTVTGQLKFSDDVLDALNTSLRRGGFNKTISSASELKRLSSNPQFLDAFSKNIDEVLDNPMFKDFARDVEIYKQAFLKKQLSSWKTMKSAGIGKAARKQFFSGGNQTSVLGKAFSNVNGFKSFSKMWYLGEWASNSDNVTIRGLGESLKTFAEGAYASLGILNVGVVTDQQKQQLEQLGKQTQKAQQNLDNISKKLLTIDTTSLSEDDLEILRILAGDE